MVDTPVYNHYVSRSGQNCKSTATWCTVYAKSPKNNLRFYTNNRVPTTEDISKITGIKKHLIRYAVMGNTIKVSFDATVGDNRDTFHDLYYDENQKKTSYVAEQNNLAKKIDEILDEFTPREKNIVQRYYGLNGYAPEIMDDIGEVHDITRERVRQILKKVLNSLRYHLVGIV